MHALQLTKFGDPGDSVRLVSRHPRQPDAGELLIDVHCFYSERCHDHALVFRRR
jgi:NADPH:quinone reductase-like Zn-dependent oxidoreductase